MDRLTSGSGSPTNSTLFPGWSQHVVQLLAEKSKLLCDLNVPKSFCRTLLQVNSVPAGVMMRKKILKSLLLYTPHSKPHPPFLRKPPPRAGRHRQLPPPRSLAHLQLRKPATITNPPPQLQLNPRSKLLIPAHPSSPLTPNLTQTNTPPHPKPTSPHLTSLISRSHYLIINNLTNKDCHTQQPTTSDPTDHLNHNLNDHTNLQSGTLQKRMAPQKEQAGRQQTLTTQVVVNCQQT